MGGVDIVVVCWEVMGGGGYGLTCNVRVGEGSVSEAGGSRRPHGYGGRGIGHRYYETRSQYCNQRHYEHSLGQFTPLALSLLL